jgi:3-phosphoshikimate 1-carboxyvinyltransferase
MGAKISATDGKAPLSIEPAEIKGVAYEMQVASGQIKSALLLASLYADGETRIYQPGPARDHTERMLNAVGVKVYTEGDWIIMPPAEGERKLQAFNLTVPGDMSSAAFPLVAAAIVPHSEVTITNVGFNDTRTGILEMLQQMGAEFIIANERMTGGEPAVDLTFHFNELHSADISGEVVVRGIDEFPVLAVAATQAAGMTTVSDAAELRVKEVDRINVLAGELAKMNIDMIERPDGFMVHGPKRPFSAEVDSHDDHRLGMALAVAGLVTYGETLIDNARCIHDSFPGFVETMQVLGATMEWVE